MPVYSHLLFPVPSYEFGYTGSVKGATDLFMTDIGELAGQTVGPYELRELLGRGSMTAVYRAYQHAKRREVAVKVMSEDLTGATGYLERFSTGARAAASLDHPHIVPFFD